VLSKLAKLLMVLTSFAPVLMTVSFDQWRRGAWMPLGMLCLASAITCGLLCSLVLQFSKRHLEVMSFQVKSLRTADQEIVGFVIAYLLPLVSTSADDAKTSILWFVLAVFALVVWCTNSYHFNPLLSFVGYHFYEVTDEQQISYVLVTRKSLREAKALSQVVQISEYMILEIGG